MTTSLLLIHRQLKKLHLISYQSHFEKIKSGRFLCGVFFYESFVDNVMRGLFATHMISTCI